MVLCASCRSALRQSLRQQHHFQRSLLSTKSKYSPSAQDILSKPTWSVRSLLSSNDSSSSSSSSSAEKISPAQLHHLLRLSALPLPKTHAEEASMIATLQSQLGFVRALQRVETRGVEPLRAIRDETDQAVRENTVTLDTLRGVLDAEKLVGHYKRPKRVRAKVESEAENWDALSTASRREGRFFVVQSGKTRSEEGAG